MEYLVFNKNNLKDGEQIYNRFVVNGVNGKISYLSPDIPDVFVTSWIRINENDTLRVDSTTSGTKYIGAIYDDNFAYVGEITSKNMQMPENTKYIRVNCDSNYDIKVYITTDNFEDLNNNIVKETILFSTSNPSVEILQDYTIHFGNGNNLSNSGSKCTKYPITVTPNDNLLFMGNFPTSMGAFYNNGAFVSGINGSQDLMLTVPSDANELKFGWSGGMCYAIRYEKTNISSTTSNPNIIVSNDTVSMNEGTSTEINVKLDAEPSSDIVINIISDNENISVDKSSLTFTSINYNVDQQLTINTVHVSDNYNNITGIISLQGTGITTKNINVTSINIDETGSTDVTYGQIVLSSTSLTVNENSTQTFTVKLDQAPTNNQIVNISVGNGNCSINKTSLEFTSDNYNTEQTVTVTGVHHSSVYTNEISTILLSSTNVSSKTIDVTIVNIDSEPITPTVPTVYNDLIHYKYARKNVKTKIFDSNNETNIYGVFPKQYVSMNNGETVLSSGFKSTSFIEVNEGDVLTVEGNFPRSMGAFYDASKKFVSGINSSDGSNPYTFTVATGVSYVRFSFSDNCVIYVTKANSSYELSSGVYLDSNKLLYGNVTINHITTDYLSKMESRWKGKIWDAYGDSITEVNFRALLNYLYFVQEQLGIKQVNNYGVSGYRFDQVATQVDSSTTTPDVITVFCGTNNFGNVGGGNIPLGNTTDASTVNSVCGHIRLVIEKLLNKHPETHIGFITPLPRSNGNSVGKQTNEIGYTMEELVDCIIEICNQYSIPVLDLYRNSNLRPWISSNNEAYFSCTKSPSGDGLHPNILGHELFIAPKVKDFLNKL